MFHVRQVNNKINCLHERPLRMSDEDITSLFDTLLEKNMSFSVHDRNIQQLALEMYKRPCSTNCYIKFILAM